MVAAILIFTVTYLLLLVLPKYRAYVALASALVFVVSGILPYNKVLSAVGWDGLNVILMIGGTMGLMSLFTASKMPALLADLVIQKTPNVKWAMIALSMFAGIVSAFVDNVATVLMVCPIAFDICKKLKISPVPCIIGIAIASNLQGAATLIGDSTSILLGSAAGLDFLDFFVLDGKPGMFWVVQAGAIMATLTLFWVFRKDNKKLEIGEKTVVKDYVPTVLLCAMLVGLICASFFQNKLPITNGLICVGLFLVGLIIQLIRSKNSVDIKNTLKDIDFFTLTLLAALFVVISGIKEAGVIDLISNTFVKISGGNLFLMYTLIVWASVLLSAFIDNIPYIATMLPVVSGAAVLMGINPLVLYFGLLSGATLGGNLTPIGASANITALGLLRKDGYEVKAREFMKISVPFTLAAVITGYVLIWLIWT